MYRRRTSRSRRRFSDSRPYASSRRPYARRGNMRRYEALDEFQIIENVISELKDYSTYIDDAYKKFKTMFSREWEELLESGNLNFKKIKTVRNKYQKLVDYGELTSGIAYDLSDLIDEQYWK